MVRMPYVRKRAKAVENREKWGISSWNNCCTTHCASSTDKEYGSRPLNLRAMDEASRHRRDRHNSQYPTNSSATIFQVSMSK